MSPPLSLPLSVSVSLIVRVCVFPPPLRSLWVSIFLRLSVSLCVSLSHIEFAGMAWPIKCVTEAASSNYTQYIHTSWSVDRLQNGARADFKKIDPLPIWLYNALLEGSRPPIGSCTFHVPIESNNETRLDMVNMNSRAFLMLMDGVICDWPLTIPQARYMYVRLNVYNK